MKRNFAKKAIFFAFFASERNAKTKHNGRKKIFAQNAKFSQNDYFHFAGNPKWETTFAKISSALDDLPIARGDTSTTNNLGFDNLCANRLKLERNNFRYV